MPKYHAKTEELARVVEDAYGVFGGYEVGKNLGFCSCDVCLSKDRQEKIIATPAEALLKGDFLALASSVPPDPPIEPNVKAWLPRVFELIARGDYVTPFMNQLFLLSPCKWRKWKPAEVDVIERFCGAYLESAGRWIPEEDLRFDPETVIITLAEVGYEWSQHLRSWIAAGTPDKLSGILWAAECLQSGKVRSGGFWESVPEAAAELTEILRAPSTLEALETAILDGAGDAQLLEWLSLLHNYLEKGASGYLDDFSYLVRSLG